MEKRIRTYITIPKSSDSHPETSEDSVYLLLQSIGSEVVDISNTLKLIEQEIEFLDFVNNVNETELLLTFAKVVRYVKQVWQFFSLY